MRSASLTSPRSWVGGHDLEAKRLIEPMLAGCARPPTGALDAAFIAPLDEDEALYFASKLRARLVAGGQLWIAGETAGNSVMASLGFAASEARVEIGDVTLIGYTFQSPTT